MMMNKIKTFTIDLKTNMGDFGKLLELAEKQMNELKDTIKKIESFEITVMPVEKGGEED